MQKESEKIISTGKAARPNKSSNTWANVPVRKAKPEIGKLTLAFSLKKARANKRLMVCLEKDSPYRAEHPSLCVSEKS